MTSPSSRLSFPRPSIWHVPRSRIPPQHHFDPDTADPAAIERRHRTTQCRPTSGVPVAPPLAHREGRTVAVVGGHAYPLPPGSTTDTVTAGSSPRPGRTPGGAPGAPEAHGTFGAHGCSWGPYTRVGSARRALVEQHAHPGPPRGGSIGWVHGDFHRSTCSARGMALPPSWTGTGSACRPARRGPYAPPRSSPYGPRERSTCRKCGPTRAYRDATGAAPSELAAAVHRV